MPAWTRLIRFKAAETGKIHYGQPVDGKQDVGLAYLNKTPIVAHEIKASSPLDPNAKLTSRKLTVTKLLSPLSREDIGIVRCIGLNYKDHAEEFNSPLPKAPVLFYKPTTVITGPGDEIVIPKVGQPVADQLPDYEVELVVVIGKTAKDVPESKALDYVLGYTVGNDVSFRTHQHAVSQWGFSKSFDDTTPMGPVLVSAAVIDPSDLKLTTTLNGKKYQDGTTANLIFNIKQLISILSQGTTLQPGTVIYTGTPKGVGAYMKPKPVWLKHGDKVDVWVEHIGTLSNPVIEEGKIKAKL